MANTNIEQILSSPEVRNIGGDAQARLEAFYRYRGELANTVSIDLDTLRSDLNDRNLTPNEKIVRLIIRVSGFEAVKNTPAWSSLSPDQQHEFEHQFGVEHQHIEPGIVVTPPDHTHPVSSGPVRAPRGSTVSVPVSAPVPRIASELAPEAGDLISDIEALKREPNISDNPFLITMLNKIEQEVRAGRNISEMQEVVNKLRSGVVLPEEPDTMAKIIGVLKKFESVDSHLMPHEAHVTLFSILVKRIYEQGARLVFQAGDRVSPTGSSDLDTFLTTCNESTRNWLKKGLVLNSTQAGQFMTSMANGTDTLPMSTFLAQKKRLLESSGSAYDADILASSQSGGFSEIVSGGLVQDGFNIGHEFQTAQKAIANFDDMKLGGPLEERFGKTAVNFTNFAYDIVKFGFIAGTAIKGTKAIWETIFGTADSQKAAWTKFGTSAAWTAGVWYGGEFLADTLSNVFDRTDRGPLVPIMAAASPHHTENVWKIWEKIGGGIVPERLDLAGTGFFEGILGGGVKWGVFRPFMTDLFMSQSTGLASISINRLAEALPPAGTASESGYGRIRELLTEVYGGTEGTALYAKYFSDINTRRQSLTILNEIVQYRMTGTDAISDRTRNVWDLFSTPLTVPLDETFDLDPQVREMTRVWTRAGHSVMKIGPTIGTFIGGALHVVSDGVVNIINMPQGMWEGATEQQREQIRLAIVGAGTLGITVGMIGLLSLIPGSNIVLMALKSTAILGTGLAGGYSLYYLYDKGRQIGESSDGLELLKLLSIVPLPIKQLILDSQNVGMTVPDIVEAIRRSPDLATLPTNDRNSINEILNGIIVAISGTPTPAPVTPVAPPVAPNPSGSPSAPTAPLRPTPPVAPTGPAPAAPTPVAPQVRPAPL